MDFGNLLRMVAQDMARPSAPDQPRVQNAGNLGPGVQWVFDSDRHEFTPFRPTPETTPTAEEEKDRGNEAYKAGRYEEAIRHYTAAINRAPDNAVYYTNRAAAYMAQEQWTPALQDVNKAIALRPDWPRGYARKGALCMKQGKAVAAVAAYSDALALEPDNAELKKALAKAEAACRRELLVEHASVDVGVQTAEVDEANLGQVIKANISMGEGAELLQTVIRLRGEHFFFDPSADQVAGALRDDLLVSSDFAKQLRRHTDSIQYADFCALQQRFYACQDRLRDCAQDTDPTAYATALKARDEVEAKLLETAKTSLDAYGRLAELEQKRAEFIASACTRTATCTASLRSYCDTSLPRIAKGPEDGEGEADAETRDDPSGEAERAVAVKRRRSCSLDAPCSSERTLDAVRAKLGEYQEWKRQLLGEVGGAVAATNAAATHFYHALRQEEACVRRNLALLHRGPALLRELAATADSTVAALEGEDVSVALQHLRSQQADFEGAHTNLLNLAACRKQAAELLEEEKELEKERLGLEKRRIKVQAEADWLKVQGEEGAPLQKATDLVQEYKERIRRVVSRQAEVEQLLADLAQTHQPELLWNAVAGGNQAKNRHLKWVKGTGAWLQRSLVDFDILRLLGTSRHAKVYLATHHGHECVLKEIPIEEEGHRKAFLNEVTIVTEVRHPFIVHINGVFQDGPMAYIVMPYYPDGTVRHYVERHCPLKPWTLQEILRQICSGVAHLHEHRVLHRDLKPSNVLMHGTQPLIADFGIAKDLSYELDTTTVAGEAPRGTAAYLAPEVLAGGRHSYASDMWALGVLLHEVATQAQPRAANEAPPPPPVLLPGRPRVEVPADLVGNPRLADLLETLLQRDPADRPTAHVLLAHPYFTVPLLQDMADTHALAQSDQKLAALAAFLQQLRATPRRPLTVVLERDDCRVGVGRLLEQLGEDLLRPLVVSFRNEAGVDEGGLLAEMYTLYFTQCVTKSPPLFVCAGEEDQGKAAEGLTAGATYLPHPGRDTPADLKAFRQFGQVLLRSLVDNAPCPFQPSLALFKFLAGVETDLSTDLEHYDKVLAHSLRGLLLAKEDVGGLGLDFEGLRPDGAEVPVTNANKAEFVQRRVWHTLIGQRQQQLNAIKEGFTSHAALAPHLQLLSPMELMIALCGAQHIDPMLLTKQLVFRGWPVASQTPKMLLELLTTLSQNNLRRFLRLTTASCVLPARGLRRQVSVVCTPNSEALPVGHTCSFQLDLPDYNDRGKLERKLGLALAHADDPFGLV